MKEVSATDIGSDCRQSQLLAEFDSRPSYRNTVGYAKMVDVASPPGASTIGLVISGGAKTSQLIRRFNEFLSSLPLLSLKALSYPHANPFNRYLHLQNVFITAIGPGCPNPWFPCLPSNTRNV